LSFAALAAVFTYHSDVGGLTVMQIVFTAIGAAIVRLALLLSARLAAGNAVLDIANALRAALAAKIGALPLDVLARGRPATLAAQLLDDVERIGAFVSGEFVDLVGAAATIVVAALLIGWRDWLAAALFVLLLAAGLVLIVAVGLRTGGALTSALSAGRAIAPARESAQRILATLAQASAAGGERRPSADRSVRFAGVSFTYPGGAAPVLRDVDFSAAAGAVTMIVGPSGSGKTTLIRLAAGFREPDRGRVEIGGIPPAEMAGEALAHLTAYVFQDVALLDDTIAANLRLGRPDAADETVAAAARAAGAHD
jgi:ATP-binding cassette subfamily B protein